VNESDSMN